METANFFRARIDAMLNLSDPLAVLATRLAWDQIEAAVATKFERQNRAGQILEGQDLFGPTQVLEGVSANLADVHPQQRGRTVIPDERRQPPAIGVRVRDQTEFCRADYVSARAKGLSQPCAQPPPS